jgi:hypothetical protein
MPSPYGWMGYLRASPPWNVASTYLSAAACGATVPLPPERSCGRSRVHRRRCPPHPCRQATTQNPHLQPDHRPPPPDVKGEGTPALNFDNSAFHSLFPDAEIAIVRIPKPPDRASPGEVAAHQARMRELVKQGIEIDGQPNEEICDAVRPVRCEPLYAKTTKANPLLIYGEDRPSIPHTPTSLQQF